MSDVSLPEGLHVFERGWLSSNNILVVGQERSALVDSGYSSHSAQTIELVRTVLGHAPLDVLLNTHLHSDHCGGNAALQSAYPQLQTFIPPGQADSVAAWDEEALTYSPTGQLCPSFGFTDTLRPGSEILLGHDHWQIHAAPGHDPHSVILFEPRSRTLISADALWERGFGVIFPELEGVEAFDEVGQTLDLIETLAPAWVIPGHGRIFLYRTEVLAYARQRLTAFAADPGRHARHAAKVLLKFKLLEKQQWPLTELVAWGLSTTYLRLIGEKFFSSVPLATWVEQLVAELVHSAAARREGPVIYNA